MNQAVAEKFKAAMIRIPNALVEAPADE